MPDEFVDDTTLDIQGALVSAGLWTGAAAVAFIPGVGIPWVLMAAGSAGGLDKLLNFGAGKKRQEFLQQLNAKFQQMHEELGDAIQDVTNSDEFFANVTRATVIAMQTSQRTKLEALQNALLNTLMPNRPGADREAILFSAIETLTAAHMKMLNFMADPNLWIQAHTSELRGLSQRNGHVGIYFIFDCMLPELKGDTMLFKLLEQDLASRGFIKQVVEGGYTINFHSPIVTLATDLGKDFIKFVRSPLPNDPDLFSQNAQEDAAPIESAEDS